MQTRFKENLEFFFEAVHKEASDRDHKVIPELEDYIAIRRDTSGCKPVFDLIEYALQIDLPEYVVSHPIIKALNQGANDLVTWSNVRLVSMCLFLLPLTLSFTFSGYLLLQRGTGAWGHAQHDCDFDEILRYGPADGGRPSGRTMQAYHAVVRSCKANLMQGCSIFSSFLAVGHSPSTLSTCTPQSNSK